MFMQVIWAIGGAMVVLAGARSTCRAGRSATFALTMIAGHNLLDGVEAEWLVALAVGDGALHPHCCNPDAGH